MSTEKYYHELFVLRSSRQQRIDRFDELMESRKYSIKTKNEKRRKFLQTESQKARLRRKKMKESHFETIRVIGRGGFGEV